MRWWVYSVKDDSISHTSVTRTLLLRLSFSELSWRFPFTTFFTLSTDLSCLLFPTLRFGLRCGRGCIPPVALFRNQDSDVNHIGKIDQSYMTGENDRSREQERTNKQTSSRLGFDKKANVPCELSWLAPVEWPLSRCPVSFFIPSFNSLMILPRVTQLVLFCRRICR